jgi:hypothetical protein
MDAKRKQDLRWAPTLEGALILAIGAVGVWSRQPLVFTSLGPTAYEQIETPERRSAEVYSVIVGHAVGLLSGLVAVGAASARSSPVVNQTHAMDVHRMAACAIAVLLTVLVNLLLRATQPAALSTTLLVALGGYQDLRGQAAIVVGVLLLAILGEPLRRMRLRMREQITDK